MYGNAPALNLPALAGVSRHMRASSRVAAVLGLLPAGTAAMLIQPSWACGCGAMVTSGTPLQVGRETSIVRYDDRTRTEQIVMRLSVRSKAADAAWVFPTPSRAEVRLGDGAWFEQLDRLTRPRVVLRRDWWSGGGGDGAGAAPGGAVDVLREQRLGPFQVATLAARDSGALAGWLDRNGYRLSPRLAGALQPYVRQGWTFVAVRLTPRGRALDGELAPLRIAFRSEEIVYPMRLSRLAATRQAVHLYVLGAHRVEQRGPRGDLKIGFAGWVQPGQVSSPGLRALIGRRAFLTELVNESLDPAAIDDDFHYSYTADRPYRETVVRTEHVRLLGIAAGPAVTVGGGLLAALGVAAGTVTAVRRRGGAGSRPAGAADR